MRLGDAAIALGRPVVVVGGTALYVRALIRGLAPTPQVDPVLRERLESLDDPHAALAIVDPALAARLHPNDRTRIVRGLEVHAQTGRPLSELQAEHAAAPDRVQAVGLWLDREDLYERIDSRVHAMIAAGYVAEVQRLLDAGVPRDAAPMRALGYRHLVEHLLDGLGLGEATRRIQRDTRRFARKQRTWKRHLGFVEVWDDHAPAVLRAAHQAFGPPQSG